MASTKLSQAEANTAKLIQQIREVPHIPTVWLPVSYVMAHAEIESNFDAAVKASDFAKTGSEGLMQVEASTVTQLSKMYALVLLKPQTDPYTSLVTGMLYLSWCKAYLLPIFKAPLLYKHVAMAYNEGPGNAAKGVADEAYYLKWRSAQQRFSFLDKPDPIVA